MKFYKFDQNNSGGSFDVNENVSHRVIIEAESENKAIEKFESFIENQSGSCSCCGDRWSSPFNDEINLEELNNTGYNVSVYTHYKDYKQRWQQLYGDFKQVEPPKIITQYTVKQYQGKIIFDSVEQYAQFLANAYGWCKPDIIIHYDNGDKKEIFTKEIKETV